MGGLDNDPVEFWRQRVRKYAKDFIQLKIEDFVARDAYPTQIIDGLIKMGVAGIAFPSRRGGPELGMTGMGAVLEELARVDSSVAAIIGANLSVSHLLARYANEQQREEFLYPLLEGKGVGAMAVTETVAGSDLAGIQTGYQRFGQGWRLTGDKAFVTNTGHPLLLFTVVLAKDEQGAPSTFLVPSDATGFATGNATQTQGWRAAGVHEIHLRECEIPEGFLLGQLGKGGRQVLHAFTYGRIAMAHIGVGLAEAAFEAAKGYAKDRRAFGTPLINQPRVQDILVEMWSNVLNARLLARWASAAADRGESCLEESAMAKWRCGALAMENARMSIQLFGGAGTRAGSPVAKLLWDAKVLEIAEGTSEIQRLILGRLLAHQKGPVE